MPLTRRQVYRRRRIVVFGGLFAVLAGITYLPLTLFAPVPTTDAVVTMLAVATPDAAVTELPDYGASAIAAIGREGLLAQAGTSDPLPMASITKIVTALTVLDTHPITLEDPGPSVTMTSADVRHYTQEVNRGGSVAPVWSGLTFTERQLIEAMLIPSGNNYATTLAVWAFGSVDTYLGAARAWLDAHGLPGVRIADASGYDYGNVGSAADLVRLGELALQHPVVAEIVSSPSVELPGLGTVRNSNTLLGVNGIDGIKTGTLINANLLFSATIEVGTRNVDLVGVVLDGPDHPTINAAITRMIDQTRAGFHEVPLVTKGEVLASYRTPWDTEVRALAAEDASILVWGDTAITAAVTADDITLAEEGADVGSVVFTAGDETVTVPIVLDGDVEDPGPWWRLWHPFGMD